MNLRTTCSYSSVFLDLFFTLFPVFPISWTFKCFSENVTLELVPFCCLPLRFTWLAHFMCTLSDCVFVFAQMPPPHMSHFHFLSWPPHPHLALSCRFLDRKTSLISFTRGSCRPHCGPAPWASLIAASMSPPVIPRDQVSTYSSVCLKWVFCFFACMILYPPCVCLVSSEARGRPQIPWY